MADQVNGTPDPSDKENEGASPKPALRPGDPGPDGAAGSDADDETEAEAMEDVQRDAAEEREENRGYQ